MSHRMIRELLRVARRTVGPAALAAVAVAVTAAVGATPVSAQGADELLAVGQMAPDFTLTTVTASGPTAAPFKLSEHRGETVVLAFFPKARTSGCTAQMHSYRDKYESMFMNGRKVRLIGISTDNAADLTSWAKDDGFQFSMGADTNRAVGALYGAARDGAFHKRYLYVIGPDGTISYATSFRPLAQQAYDELDAALKKAAR